MKFHRTGLCGAGGVLRFGRSRAWADRVAAGNRRHREPARQRRRRLPQSVSVLDAGTLQAAGVQHFEDVLTMIPNLSWASGSSRPRFFLMRGIGEVEQYQGAPNPSVGFLIDDIDFSGVGMPATLFDTRQIEVLRGPQGTVYGANALAGLIAVRTEDPTPHFSLHGEATLGDYQTRAAGVAVSDSFDESEAGWRVAAQQYRSDGYRMTPFCTRRHQRLR
jgi:iron complex outermembrane receptor protein